MSYINLNHAIINKKNGDMNERRTEHSQEGLRGVGNNSKGISRKIKHWSVICFGVEQRKQKDTKWDTFSLRTSYRKPSAQKRFRDNRRLQKNTKQNKIINIFLISDKKLDFVLKINYNPIILKIKGLDMLQNAQQKSHLKKLVMGSEIENGVEYKLRAFHALLEALEMTDDTQPIVFNTLSNTVESIIKDVEALRERVDYMFSYAVEGGGELCNK